MRLAFQTKILSSMIYYCADKVEARKQCAETRGAEKLEESFTLIGSWPVDPLGEDKV